MINSGSAMMALLASIDQSSEQPINQLVHQNQTVQKQHRDSHG